MGILVTCWVSLLNCPAMEANWFHKLLLCVVLAALTAGLIQFYHTFVTGADAEMRKGIKDRSHIQP